MHPAPLRLRGIVPPLATPLLDRDRLDLPALSRLLDHILAGGVSGIFALGTTGEGPGLSYRLRQELVERTCEFVAGRAPVLVGVTDSSLAETLALAEWSRDCGAAAIVAAPPPYMPIEQREAADYFRRLAEQSPLPLVIYNMPQCVKLSLAPQTVAACADLENVIGIKDSSGDLALFTEFVRLKSLRPDWSVLIGPEHLLGAATRLGGDGGVCGGANLAPRLFVEMFEASAAGDRAKMDALQSQIDRLGTIYRLEPTFSAVIRGLKLALNMAGLCENIVAAPYAPFAIEERERIRSIVEELLAVHTDAARA